MRHPAALRDSFAPRLLAWFQDHGRHDLPWQQAPDPYRVWVSEIMLQQTQVATVIPYYRRFLLRFPDLAALAAAPLDEVLRHWSGLGYYARARLLHRTAQELIAHHGGRFPADFAQLQELPGIGRSTAGAIVSLALGQRAAILDGNVKRVFCRCFAIPGWPGTAKTQRLLWELAEVLLPATGCGPYNQALMDLGAGVCTRSHPRCGDCPLGDGCRAHRDGTQARYPEPPPRRTPPVRTTQLLLLRDPEGALLLERRPPTGVWGGLWSLPECPPGTDIESYCRERWGLIPGSLEFLPARRHTFSHFRLDYVPVVVRVAKPVSQVREPGQWLWQDPGHPTPGGVPAPISQLIDELREATHEPDGPVCQVEG